MAEIINLPPRDQDKVVWRCNCGCLSFALRADGEAECVQCQGLVNGAGGEWRAKLPEPTAQLEAVGAGDVSITDLNSSAPALKRALGKAEPGVTAMVIVVQQDGGVTTWGADIESDEQADWFDRRVSEAKRMLTKRIAS